MADGRERLQAWTLMDELVLDVYEMTRRLPTHGADDVVAALRGAAVRAALRIVQSVHGSETGFDLSLRSALSMLSELRYYLYLARRLGLIDLRRYRGACARHEKVQKSLHALREKSAAAGSSSVPRSGSGHARAQEEGPGLAAEEGDPRQGDPH